MQLLGGLGNQLFQYSMGRAVALRLGTDLKLDIRALQKSSLRHYSLYHLNISADVATAQDLNRVIGAGPPRWRRSLLTLLQHGKPYFRRRTVHEKQEFVYDPNLGRLPRNVYLVGYWQNQRYFCSIRKQLRQELSLKRPLTPSSRDFLRRIRSTDSVSLHVRRGDYASSAETYQTHGLCSKAYYTRAVATISQLTAYPHFFVFSDEVDWVRRNLVLDSPTTYVSSRSGDHEHEDFWLMSQCKHHIIANSTFSWWAAWLHDDGQKAVIAPKKWIRADGFDTRGLVPSHWHELA